MAKKEKKSKAEIYREERKKRIAKAGKSNAKKASSTKVGKVIKAVVAAVIVLAVVLGGVYYVLDATGVKGSMITALTVNGEKVSESQFYYYYYLAYQRAASNAEQYAQYASYGMNLMDTSKSPDDQEYAEGKTWADALADDAKTAAQSIIANYKEAVKVGVKVDDDMQKTIDETIASLKTNAESSGYSFSAYIRAQFHMSEKALRKQLEMEQISIKYQEQKQEDYEKAVTDADLNAELEKNPNTYGLADIRCYAMQFDTLTKEDGETDEAFAARTKKANAATVKEANAFDKAVTDENTFKAQAAKFDAAAADAAAADAAAADAAAADAAAADAAADAAAADAAAADAAAADAAAADAAAAADTAAADAAAADTAAKAEEPEEDTTLYDYASYNTISSVAEKAGADWAFAADRKAGDHKVIEGENGAYILYIVSPKSLDAHSVTVRYCLVPYNSDNTTYASEEERETAKDTATKYYDEWKKGEATEESFGTLCTNYSADTSTSADGGKIDVRLNTMVSAFEDWCFDAKRKAGDCEVIEATEYGYFLVYFVSDNKDDLDWKNTATATLSDTAYQDYTTALLAEDGEYKIVPNDKVVNGVIKDFCKLIKRNIAMNEAYGNYSN